MRALLRAAIQFERISLITGNAQAKSRIAGEALVRIRRFLGE